ncbi:6-phosphogluconate dehydrogenase NAD-binding protein [Monoraphidium neglectum]|uniref:6-phosphogluconate dehydrogenase NAD-binding protein n=1 Tax=Monoraphidium neglectum TaxID=145388 RepID=A0A0D2MJ22_9CHLO|nr:6-phosphogluconate dehydrogenase NAD-binding protein [Monoraphidium neglectum]KIY95000.1 6-phosphogluconate dehydrogenase NAD-binding protein [Monoraphidium neglectum]|eukprot:XP_013894020.1 6-phosphogluconate dehydrogenase NAD-binding protein [Monoraphidium neglectum]
MSATAFVGLGAMGLPMATNLAAAISNQPLIIYNRSRAKSDTLASAAPPGAVKAAATLQEVAGAASIVHLMLADDSACDAVITELLKGSQGGGDGAHLAAGSVIVNHSTVHPGCSKRAAAAAEEAGVEYVAAPVFGRPDAAAARKLLVVPAGPPAVLRRVAAHLEALGRVLPPVGEDASKANVLKLTGNFMIAGAIEMISEALAVSEKHGVPGDSILGFIEAFFPAPPIVVGAERFGGGGEGGRRGALVASSGASVPSASPQAPATACDAQCAARPSFKGAALMTSQTNPEF